MYFGEHPQIDLKPSDKYYFVCPNCRTNMERGFMPQNVIHCSVCNKSSTAKECQIVPDMFSLANKQFKDIADIFCDRWNPKTAFIYAEHAVFQFHNKEDLETMCTYIDSHTLMFDGLDFLMDDDTHLLMTKGEPEEVIVAG